MWLRYEPLSACIDCTTLANEHGKETFDAVTTVLAYSTQTAEFELWRRYEPQLGYPNFCKILINFSQPSYIKSNSSVVGHSVYLLKFLTVILF